MDVPSDTWLSASSMLDAELSMVGEDRGDRVRGSLARFQLEISDLWASSDEQSMLNEKNTADNLVNALILQQSSHPFLNYFGHRQVLVLCDGDKRFRKPPCSSSSALSGSRSIV
ncbi:unnamed protein product [Arctogadus glacialis]